MTIPANIVARYAAAQKGLTYYRYDGAAVATLLKRLNDKKAQRESRQELGGYHQAKFKLVPIKDIVVPPVWHPDRIRKVQEAMDKDVALPPIQLTKGSSGKLEITDGIHRTNASQERGLTLVPAIVSEWIPTPQDKIPTPAQKPQLPLGAWVKLHKAEKDQGQSFSYGYIDERLSTRNLDEGIKRYYYSVALVHKTSAWPSFMDLPDTTFEPVAPPPWGESVKQRVKTH